MTDKVAELIADATAKRETELKKDLQKAEESFERCKDKLKLFEELQIDPETDSIETQIAKQYIKTYKADIVSQWAFEMIPDYASSKYKAKIRTDEILDSFTEQHTGIFKTVYEMRKQGKFRAQNMLY